MAKKAKDAPVLYIAAQRTKWVRYVEEGEEDDPIQVELLLRKNLTNGELDTLQFDPLPVFLKDDDGNDLEGDALTEAQERFREAVSDRVAEMDEALAPFVHDWNVGYLTPSGEPMKADPPAVAGGPQLRTYLPGSIVDRVYRDLVTRSTGLVKAKSWTPAESTDDTTGDSSSTPTGTAEA